MNARDDMSDTDVLTAVRGSLSAMPLADPPDVETIMARGRARRRRRLIPGVTGTLAVAAGAALAVTTLAPAGHPASHQTRHQPGRQPAVQLAAWTVAKLADGNISVTIRELKDPAGLQGTLRADGVRASVTFASQRNPACRPYPGGTLRQAAPPQPIAPTRLLRHVFPRPYQVFSPPLPLRRGMRPAQPFHGRPPALPRPSPDRAVIVIDPAALPGNAGVQLGVSPTGGFVLLPQVVYASPRCTGS
jgi:hypothetical protein